MGSHGVGRRWIAGERHAPVCGGTCNCLRCSAQPVDLLWHARRTVVDRHREQDLRRAGRTGLGSRALRNLDPAVSGPVCAAADSPAAGAGWPGGCRHGRSRHRVCARACDHHCAGDRRAVHRAEDVGPDRALPRPRTVHPVHRILWHRDGGRQRMGGVFPRHRSVYRWPGHIRIGIRPAGAIGRSALSGRVQRNLLYLHRHASRRSRTDGAVGCASSRAVGRDCTQGRARNGIGPCCRRNLDYRGDQWPQPRSDR